MDGVKVPEPALMEQTMRPISRKVGEQKGSKVLNDPGQIGNGRPAGCEIRCIQLASRQQDNGGCGQQDHSESEGCRDGRREEPVNKVDAKTLAQYLLPAHRGKE